MHTPVLLNEVIENLKIKPGGLYIDATLGEAGYTKEIINKGGNVLAIDWDPGQIKNIKNKFKAVEGNFADIEEIAKKNEFYPVDGVVFDLGLSMSQIRESGKGFSYNKPDEILDMRLNPEIEKSASDLINSLGIEELYEIFSRYSEEINSRPIAQAIVRARQMKRIEKVSQLLSIIDRVVGYQSKRVYGRIFQAMRVAVNNEFENLKKALIGAFDILRQEGRVVVVTFHSGEDRIVKNFVRENNLKQIHKKVIKGDYRLSFERSAKLRVISKK